MPLQTTDERTTDTGCGISEGTTTCDSIGCCCTSLCCGIIVERISLTVRFDRCTIRIPAESRMLRRQILKVRLRLR